MQLGATVWFSVNAEQSDRPVIELSTTELRRRLSGAECDLADYAALVPAWPPGACPTLRFRHGGFRPWPRPSCRAAGAVGGVQGEEGELVVWTGRPLLAARPDRGHGRMAVAVQRMPAAFRTFRAPVSKVAQVSGEMRFGGVNPWMRWCATVWGSVYLSMPSAP